MVRSENKDVPPVFRYKGRRTTFDRCVLMLWILAAMGIPFLWIIGHHFWALVMIVPLVSGLCEYFAKDKLEIHHDQFVHGNPHMVRETVKYEAVGELLESEHDLRVVHQRKSEWVRLTFSKDGFCPHCWPQMVRLMAERTAAQSPYARIELKSPA